MRCASAPWPAPARRPGPRRRALAGLVAGMLALGAGGARAGERIAEPWRWVRFGDAHGLPSTQVYAVEASGSGRTWAFTREGPAWYDGYRWHAAPAGEPSPRVDLDTTYARTPDGLVVVEGGALWRERGGAFEPLPPPPEAIQLGGVGAWGAGGLLAAGRRRADSALCGWVLEQGAWQPAPLPTPAGSQSAARLFATQTGALWLLADGGAWRCRPPGPWERRSSPGAWRSVHAVEEPEAGPALVVGSDGVGREALWSVPTTGPEAREPLLEGARFRLALAPDGWGLAVGEDGRAYRRAERGWAPVPEAVEALAAAHALRVRGDGSLWAATSDGLWLARLSRPSWTRLSPAPAAGAERIHGIERGGDGRLWLATAAGLLEVAPDGAARLHDRPAGEPAPILTTVALDGEGAVWVGSGASFEGALRWRAGAWSRVGPEQGLPAPRVHRIRRGRDGRLWFLAIGARYEREATGGGPGAWVLDHGRFLHVAERAAPGSPGLLHGRVYDLVEGPDGSRWFATAAGISREREGVWSHWTPAEGLPAAPVNSLALDGQGRLWFGAARAGSAGWIEADRATGVPPGHALDRREILDLEADADGRVWAALDEGLAWQAPGEALRWSTIGWRHGLPHARCYTVRPEGDALLAGTLGQGVLGLPRGQLPRPGTPRLTILRTDVDELGHVAVAWEAHAADGELEPAALRLSLAVDDGPFGPWSAERVLGCGPLAAGPHRLRFRTLAAGWPEAHPESERRLTVAPPWHRRPAFLLPVVGLSLAAGAFAVLAARRRRALRRTQTAQRQEAARLETLGLLAGGVAHDFNNLLVGVLGNADLALRSLPADAPDRPLLEGVIAAARHATALTGQLLTLTGRQPHGTEVIDLGQALRSLEGLLATTAGPRVRLTLGPPAGPAPVRADRTQITQALVNLVGNAAEALGARGGQVGVSVRAFHADRTLLSDTHLPDALAPGPVVALEVADDGPGIPPEVRARVFDPFVSTRGQRRGLGLAVVLGVVRGHGGTVRLSGRPGGGTTFTLLFPRAAGPAEPERVDPVEPGRGGEGGRVLVVDDEPAVRAVLTEMLRRLGFHPEPVEGGRAAVEALESRGGAFRAMLLDMTMPDLPGDVVLARARARWPDLPVLIVSGFTEEEAARRLAGLGPVPVLTKPFRLERLKAALLELLAAPPAARRAGGGADRETGR